MSARIIKGHIVISVPIKSLSTAYKGTIDMGRRTDGYENFRIVDERAFAKDLAIALNEEEEDGQTAIHDLFDRAMERAIDDGARGVAVVVHLPDCYGHPDQDASGAGHECKCPVRAPGDDAP